MTREDFHLKDVFRSDKLPTLLNLAQSISAFSPFIEDFVKFRIVLDASAAQEHLHALLVGKRTNLSATTSIHEAIVSGVVVAFAPASRATP